MDNMSNEDGRVDNCGDYKMHRTRSEMLNELQKKGKSAGFVIRHVKTFKFNK